MKMNKIFSLAAMALPLTAFAQGTTEVLPNIQFESTDFKGLGVYDTWEESPFRVNKFANPTQNAPLLNGAKYVEVIDNFTKNDVDDLLGAVVNPSEKILAVQRSRFGSNTFGARINLNQTFELTPTIKYLHVMVYRPYGGRVMVVGLGKRKDNEAQPADTEQFWALSNGNIPANKWFDVVLPIKGNGGIDIHSLVVVPDCESPHAYAEDKMCYIDNVVVNNDPRPSVVYENYAVNFDKSAVNKRADRYFSAIGLNNQKAVSPNVEHLFYTLFDRETFYANAGDQVTPKFTFKTSGPMYGYVYLDKNKNGRFDQDELMSQSASGNNAINVPAFTIPQDLSTGYYYMRYKIDWDNIDPAGSLAPGNELTKNGGGIMDIRLNVHGSECAVGTGGLNGDAFAVTADGKEVPLNNYKAKFNEPLKIKMKPAPGFSYSHITVKHGYNFEGDSIVNGCKQWSMSRFDYVDFNDKDELIIPASFADGDQMHVENYFTEVKGEPFSINPAPQSNNLKNTFYLIKGTSDKGTGYVYCDGNKLVIDHNITFTGKVAENQYKYLWSVSNDGKGNYQLENYMDLYYFGNGNYQTQEFSVTAPASFTLNEVSPKFAQGKWCTMQTSQGGHTTYIHMNGGVNAGKLGYWDSGSVGNEASSIALFQFFEIQAIPRIRVAYEYILDGRVIKTVKKIQGPQSNYKAPALNMPGITMSYADNKKVSADNCNITVNVVEQLPFVKTLDKKHPKSQAIDMRGSDKILYWNVLDDGSVKASKPAGDRSDVDLLTTNAYQWCFMGNRVDGFKIYNLKKGMDYALKNTDPATLVPEEQASRWFFTEGNADIPGSVCLYAENNKFLNWQSDNLKYWHQKDAGSSVRFFEPFATVEGSNDHLTMPGLVGGHTYFDDAAKSKEFKDAFNAAKAEPNNAAAANAYAKQLKAAKTTGFKAEDNVKAGKYYRIKNYKRMIDKRGSNNNYDRAFQGGYLGTTPYPNNTKQFTCGTESLDDAGTVWGIVDAGNGNFKLKNMNTGKFAGKQDNREGQWVTLQDEAGAGVYHLVKAADGQYKIQCGNDVFHLSAPGIMYYNSADDASKWLLIEASELEVRMATIGEASYASLYLPFAVSLPESTEAYTGVLNEAASTLGMQQTGIKVPANTGIVVKNINKQNKVTFEIVNTEVTAIDNNSLSGTNVSLTLNDGNRGNYWVLGNHPTDGLGFYHFTGNQLGMNKAFLSNLTSAVNGFRLDFGDLTGIESAIDETTKCDAIYDLTGRKVTKMSRGLYIINGKKVYVK